jgi:hypothetical protein
MARPVRDVVTHLFGDPANPGMKSLNSYSDIADDPQKVKEVGNALRLILADTDKLTVGSKSNGWRAGGGLGTGALLPVNIHGEGGVNGLSRYLDLSSDQSSKINSTIDSAMSQLKDPRERELVDATMKAFEATVGMRSVTQSSSALAAVHQIQQTLPVMGVNTFNKKDFKDRMIRWAQDGLNGTWGIPTNYIGTDVIKQLRDVASGKTTEFDPGSLKRIGQ